MNREARDAIFPDVTKQAAYVLRENTGTSGVVQTAQTAVATLAVHDIRHLEDLLSLKLDSSAHSPLRRLRDKTDVVELILRRKLPRDLPVAPVVRPLYRETWDALRAES